MAPISRAAFVAVAAAVAFGTVNAAVSPITRTGKFLYDATGARFFIKVSGGPGRAGKKAEGRQIVLVGLSQGSFMGRLLNLCSSLARDSPTSALERSQQLRRPTTRTVDSQSPRTTVRSSLNPPPSPS